MTWKYAVLLPLLVASSVSAALGAASTARAERAVDVDPAVKDALDTMIQDEYEAEVIYRRVLHDFGEIRPFSNIVWAEQRHSAAIAALYRARGLPVPASRFSPENVPAYGSVREACAAALEDELENIALYDRYLERALPDDVRAAFEYNRRASLEHHVPAFRRCVARR
ncbi:hypothetical protein WMF31_37115 [Sorangium sp. So ce1036]|uniref:ferritin-like domain-containing protein n=1 Tax=Sorangium sp. So ce1036 TaxID=3133328 RepID=UPI003F10C9DB